MKKTIKIEVPDKLPGLDNIEQPEGVEGVERFDPRKDAAKRRALAIDNAIAKRTKKPRVEETELVLVEEEYTKEEKQAGKGIDKEGKSPKKKSLSVDMDLTQEEINKLPIGLKKMLN